MKRLNKISHGSTFRLIEVLVVIAIIATLQSWRRCAHAFALINGLDVCAEGWEVNLNQNDNNASNLFQKAAASIKLCRVKNNKCKLTQVLSKIIH